MWQNIVVHLWTRTSKPVRRVRAICLIICVVIWEEVTNSCGLQDKTHGKTIGQTDYIGPRPRQATLEDIGQLHNDCQMDLSPKEQTVGRSTLARWASSTQLPVEKRTGLSLPKSSGTVAGLWTWKNQGTCQLVRAGRAVFSLLSRQSVSQNV